MGTNYYMKRKSQPDLKLHIGKMSYGYRFLMAGHLLNYDETTNISLTIASFQDYFDFMKKYPDAYIENEYGNKVNIRDLWKDIVSRKNCSFHKSAHIKHKHYDIIFNQDFC